MLDFNNAYNPACAVSEHYNCPIPPRANTLKVAIRAGEKDFALPGTRNLSELLTKHKIDNKLQVNGGGHTWLNWRLYLSELLPLLFR